MIQGSDHVKNNKIPNTLPLPALLWMGCVKVVVSLEFTDFREWTREKEICFIWENTEPKKGI